MKNLLASLNRTLLSAAILLLLAIWIWLYSRQFPDLEEGYPGPKLFPRVIALGLALIGLGLGLGALRNRTSPASPGAKAELAGEKSAFRLVVGIVLLGIFPLISPLIGFIPALLLTGALIGLTLQVIWWRSILTAAITVGLIYLIFSRLLNVPL